MNPPLSNTSRITCIDALLAKMSTFVVVALFFLLAMATTTTATFGLPELEMVQMARAQIVQARNWVKSSSILHGLEMDSSCVAVSDCAKLYVASESRLTELLADENYTSADASSWLSGVLANHRTCLDGLKEKGFIETQDALAQNLTFLISEALALYGKSMVGKGVSRPSQPPTDNPNGGLLTSWSPATSKAHFVVAKDGSGTHTTINNALAALAKMGSRRAERVIIYVKAGVYNEKVEIDRHMKNLMFVGDGIDRTIVTSNHNVPDGSTTYSSATFAVSGDGFWARDMTFENSAGPQKGQAVALRVNADLSVLHRCSFRAYQDTLFVHSLRQFYRDCHIYGTVDFIFGDASVVFQNCDIFVRRTVTHRTNFITAQGREIANENTGISIQGSRVRPAPDLFPVEDSFRTYLGRPWKKYSRTVFLKTDLDALIDPSGWHEWQGNFALSTLYYAEYMNTGVGASTSRRVRWPGFHVLNDPQQASLFAVGSFIQGESWIPVTGVPCELGI